MYATLPRPTEAKFKKWLGSDFTEAQYQPQQTWGQPWREASEQQRLAYIELMGKEPPAPRSNEMRVQFEYGHGQYRTKAMRSAILMAAEERQPQLIAA
jgi:hypothetical protein